MVLHVSNLMLISMLRLLTLIILSISLNDNCEFLS